MIHDNDDPWHGSSWNHPPYLHLMVKTSLKVLFTEGWNLIPLPIAGEKNLPHIKVNSHATVTPALSTRVPVLTSALPQRWPNMVFLSRSISLEFHCQPYSTLGLEISLLSSTICLSLGPTDHCISGPLPSTFQTVSFQTGFALPLARDPSLVHL